VAYAIIQVRGKQFRVSQGEVVRVPSFQAEAGALVQFQVLARSAANGIEIGTPLISGSTVTGTVVEHGRERKVIVFKMKRKKQYKRTHGHRQNFTAVRIESIGDSAIGETSGTVETAAPAKADLSRIEDDSAEHKAGADVAAGDSAAVDEGADDEAAE